VRRESLEKEGSPLGRRIATTGCARPATDTLPRSTADHCARVALKLLASRKREAARRGAAPLADSARRCGARGRARPLVGCSLSLFLRTRHLRFSVWIAECARQVNRFMAVELESLLAMRVEGPSCESSALCERHRAPRERHRAPRERHRAPRERHRAPRERHRAPRERHRAPRERQRPEPSQCFTDFSRRQRVRTVQSPRRCRWTGAPRFGMLPPNVPRAIQG
jgi:hypothetical protein